MPVNRTCEYCGKSYQDQPSRRIKYCSRECASAATDKRLDITCLQCGIITKQKISDINKGLGKYCSKKCFDEAQKRRTILICQLCGKTFSVRNQNAKQKYCSNTCRGQATSIWHERTCMYCGRIFNVKGKVINRKRGQYCSRACRMSAKIGDQHPLWQGGSVDFGVNWHIQRDLAYKRDNGMCQHCGLTESQSVKKYGARCSVHHIEKRRAFKERGEAIENANILTNLITLCASCHHRAEFGKIAIQPKLL